MKKINDKWYTDKQYIEILEEENERLKEESDKLEAELELYKDNNKYLNDIYKNIELYIDNNSGITKGVRNKIKKILKGEE